MDVMDLFSRMESHAMTLGVFDRVNTHEVIDAPGKGYTAAIWVDRIQPVLSSGLNSTSARVAFNVRLYTPLEMSPLDSVDPQLLANTDLLMSAYSGDFTLDGTVREVDLLGEFGPGLEAQAGYINVGGTMFRVMTLTVPVIVNDVWDQEE